MTSRTCLVLVFFLGLPATLCAQKQQGQWSDLRGLKVGQGIVVIESSMKHHGGEFVSVSDETLTLQEKGSDVSVKREDVVRVSTASGSRRGEHAVIGLVVGAAAGAAIGAIAADHSTGNSFWSWKAQPGIGALVGIVIGAPIGARSVPRSQLMQLSTAPPSLPRIRDIGINGVISNSRREV
jgi:hypothetical protein